MENKASATDRFIQTATADYFGEVGAGFVGEHGFGGSLGRCVGGQEAEPHEVFLNGLAGLYEWTKPCLHVVVGRESFGFVKKFSV